MNNGNYAGTLFGIAYRLALTMRRIGAASICESFGNQDDRSQTLIQQIYVINLDRQVRRWNQISQELQMLSSRSGKPLAETATRFSAVDARYYEGSPDTSELRTCYPFADQLFVEPNHLIAPDQVSEIQHVEMTRQEVAVALSHIAIWKLVASGDHIYTLVLEDDVFFRRGFGQVMNKAWTKLTESPGSKDAFDVLYLSYKETKSKVQKRDVSESLFRPVRGLWQLSGYVLSRRGAKRLLELLPVCGPVDLWINKHFDKLEVFATRNSIIDQRLDYHSDNSYSILPVLAKVGLLINEKPSLFEQKGFPEPVFACGPEGTGLTSLAMALSMLGFRCCSDIDSLPKEEHAALFARKRDRVFNAYVNVGSLCGLGLVELAQVYKRAKFIITVPASGDCHCGSSGLVAGGRECDLEKDDYSSLARNIEQFSESVLLLPLNARNKWELICNFLGCDYPASEYPTCKDQRRRRCFTDGKSHSHLEFPRSTQLKFDSSPWIAPARKEWSGIFIDENYAEVRLSEPVKFISERFEYLDRKAWILLNDTFPSNLALFRPENFSIDNDCKARLTLQKEFVGVRDYTAASIASRQAYQYGRFSAILRPANVPGLVTGLFLHRNSPRQEIDIEFLGKDTTRMLINVYYNPGCAGARFDYGNRGTPVLVDLGFDASADFHQYSIEWTSTSIRWFVDDRLVHQRVDWDPTPIPDLPMQFFTNLWPCRSEELAGRLSDRDLPAYSEVKLLEMHVTTS